MDESLHDAQAGVIAAVGLPDALPCCLGIAGSRAQVELGGSEGGEDGLVQDVEGDAVMALHVADAAQASTCPKACLQAR